METTSISIFISGNDYSGYILCLDCRPSSEIEALANKAPITTRSFATSDFRLLSEYENCRKIVYIFERQPIFYYEDKINI